MTDPMETDFDDWLVAAFRETGPFTVLVVLVGIGETTVDLLRSTHLHVIGDETRWPDLVALFAGAGIAWSGAVFFRAAREGLVQDAEAKRRLSALTRHLHEDRSTIRDGEFFNRDGLRLRLDDVKPS